MRRLDPADLGRVRETRGLALDDLARRTRVPLRLLVDLEAGRFDRWPKGLYARGHLRAYARVLGLDPDTVVDVAPAALLSPESVEQIRACHDRHVRQNGRPFLLRPLTALATGAALVLGAIAWTVVEQKSAGMEKPDDPRADPGRPAARPVATAGVKAVPSGQAANAGMAPSETRIRRTPRRAARQPAPPPPLAARSIAVPPPVPALAAKAIVTPEAPVLAPVVTPAALNRPAADPNPLKKLGRGLRKVFVGR